MFSHFKEKIDPHTGRTDWIDAFIYSRKDAISFGILLHENIGIVVHQQIYPAPISLGFVRVKVKENDVLNPNHNCKFHVVEWAKSELNADHKVISKGQTLSIKVGVSFNKVHLAKHKRINVYYSSLLGYIYDIFDCLKGQKNPPIVLVSVVKGDDIGLSNCFAIHNFEKDAIEGSFLGIVFKKSGHKMLVYSNTFFENALERYANQSENLVILKSDEPQIKEGSLIRICSAVFRTGQWIVSKWNPEGFHWRYRISGNKIQIEIPEHASKSSLNEIFGSIPFNQRNTWIETNSSHIKWSILISEQKVAEMVPQEPDYESSEGGVYTEDEDDSFCSSKTLSKKSKSSASDTRSVTSNRTATSCSLSKKPKRVIRVCRDIPDNLGDVSDESCFSPLGENERPRDSTSCPFGREHYGAFGSTNSGGFGSTNSGGFGPRRGFGSPITKRTGIINSGGFGGFEYTERSCVSKETELKDLMSQILCNTDIANLIATRYPIKYKKISNILNNTK